MYLRMEMLPRRPSSTRLDEIKNFHDPVHLGFVADAGACSLGEGQLVRTDRGKAPNHHVEVQPR